MSWPGHIILQDSEVSSAEIFAESLEERRLRHNQLRLVGDSSCLEVELPVKARIVLDEFLGTARVVLSLNVPFLNACPGVFRKHILDRKGVGRGLLRLRRTGQGEDLGEEVAIALLDGGVLGLDVIVTVSDSQTALSKIEDLIVAVGEVGHHIGPEE